MSKKNRFQNNIIPIIIFIILAFVLIRSCSKNSTNSIFSRNTFKIIASTSTKKMDADLISYAKTKGINLEIEHYGDLEIVDILNRNSHEYDAVWISNSIWFYMLDNPNLITDSKSIVVDPVVLGIEKKKAEELGFTKETIYNKDILNAIKDGKFKYIMSSVTKTNTGASTYLNFLNRLAGNPEILTEEMLEQEQLGEDLKNFFKGVERVSGDEEYLVTMYLNGNYNAMINYESSMIDLNKELIKLGRDPLYFVYPKDGVAINDMPFAYLNYDSMDQKTKEKFLILQNYLRSEETILKMEELGYRSWYGGIKKDVNKKIFNPEWGIDTTVYLKDMKYPSKKVITKAIELYIEKLRKPTHVVFCLDISGSMYGSGVEQLKEAMNSILDYESASVDNLQFSKYDKISLITFNGKIDRVYDTKFGNETKEVIGNINQLTTGGSTNIYDPSIKALEILNEDSDEEYTKTIILMTDGQSNTGSFRELKDYYDKNKLQIPIYGITFGESDERQLQQIAKLTNSKVFDGKSGLRAAFAEVRSYN